MLLCVHSHNRVVQLSWSCRSSKQSRSQDGIELSFTGLELLLSVFTGLFSIWYLKHKHWFANNVLGLAFSLQGIEHLSLGSVATGVILLSGTLAVRGYQFF